MMPRDRVVNQYNIQPETRPAFRFQQYRFRKVCKLIHPRMKENGQERCRSAIAV